MRMSLEEQLNRLYKIQEDIRVIQESGLWEPLHNSKLGIIKLINQLEKIKTERFNFEVEKLMSEIETEFIPKTNNVNKGNQHEK